MIFNSKKSMKKIASVVLMGGLCAGSIFTTRAFARDVYVNVDNSTIHSVTIDSNVDNILGNVGIKVSENDIVEQSENSDGSLNLNIKRAFEVLVSVENKKKILKVTEGTVASALKMCNIELSENDMVSFPLEKKLEKDMKIEVIRMVKLKVLADGEEKEVLMPTYYTVEDTLNQMHLSFSKDDIINADLNSVVSNDMKIEITRIKFEEITKDEPIERKIVYKTTDSLNEGKTEVVSEGQDGMRKLKIKQKTINGEIVESEILSDEVISQPVEKVILKGTKKVSSSNTSDCKTCFGTVSNVFYGSATAYTASSGARTSTGNRPIEGQTVAVNPKLIPYGSHVLVESTDGSYRKEFIAQDTGGALRKGSAVVDIYMDSTSSCKQFGRKNVKVSILK